MSEESTTSCIEATVTKIGWPKPGEVLFISLPGSSFSQRATLREKIMEIAPAEKERGHIVLTDQPVKIAIVGDAHEAGDQAEEKSA